MQVYDEMNKNVIVKISDAEIKEAYKIMQEKQLVFFPAYAKSVEKLTEFVKEKNGQIYKKPEFTFLETNFDLNLIIAAVPELGPKQLGVFAAKEFQKDDIIAVYKGEDLWGKLPTSQIHEKINQYEKSGDYFWEIRCKNEAIAVDSTTKGSIARFVNDSLQTNAYVEIEQHKLYYKAKNRIRFGEEITVSYGESYFSESHPRIEYIPKSLSTILNNLFTLNNPEELYPPSLASISEIHIFLEALGWNLSSMLGRLSPKMVKRLKLPEERNNDGKNFYLDDKDNPLIFDLSDNSKNDQLAKAFMAKFVKTSPHKLFIAPTNHEDEGVKFSLFAGQLIKKNTVICDIKGENLTQNEIQLNDQIDAKYFFEINKNLNLYCKNYGSEALFVQGVSESSLGNVKLSVVKNIPKYIATKDILAGDEIVAFYGKDYPCERQVTSMEEVITSFNSQQLVWDAFLSYSSTKQDYTIEFFPHISTPGRELSFEEDTATVCPEGQQNFSVPNTIPNNTEFNQKKSVLNLPIWKPEFFHPQYKPTIKLPLGTLLNCEHIHKKGRFN